MCIWFRLYFLGRIRSNRGCMRQPIPMQNTFLQDKEFELLTCMSGNSALHDTYDTPNHFQCHAIVLVDSPHIEVWLHYKIFQDGMY